MTTNPEAVVVVVVVETDPAVAVVVVVVTVRTTESPVTALAEAKERTVPARATGVPRKMPSTLPLVVPPRPRRKTVATMPPRRKLSQKSQKCRSRTKTL